MRISAFTVALTVDDVPASRDFLINHFGFREAMSADGFVSLGRDGAGLNIVYLRRGIEVLPESVREQTAQGVIIAFTVADANAEASRLQAEGVPISLPMRDEPWGERLFQVADNNGIAFEIVEWLAGSGQESAPAAVV
ncbi:MAG TPA: VOC family protein [Bosea sp. (in: a-proteobacteria)]|jgi:catechol 2,3-dioxygenase-like lactoylglutathione lyase family enzyme|nr:VOC family protein [Bosea sp. (in: a-proteobacteria)]